MIEDNPTEDQRTYIQCLSQDSTGPGFSNIRELAEAMCGYDLDDMDLHWLHALNRELACMGETWHRSNNRRVLTLSGSLTVSLSVLQGSRPWPN